MHRTWWSPHNLCCLASQSGEESIWLQCSKEQGNCRHGPNCCTVLKEKNVKGNFSSNMLIAPVARGRSTPSQNVFSAHPLSTTNPLSPAINPLNALPTALPIPSTQGFLTNSWGSAHNCPPWRPPKDGNSWHRAHIGHRAHRWRNLSLDRPVVQVESHVIHPLYKVRLLHPHMAALAQI